MPYNPNIHHRRSIRLKGYDYSQAGLYFITICVQNRECLFGGASLVDAQNEMDAQNEKGQPQGIARTAKMILNDAGKMVENEWLKIPDRFTNVHLHEYVVMPNHFHAIMEIAVGETLVVAQNDNVANENEIRQPQGIAPTDTQNDNVANENENRQPQGITPTDTQNDNVANENENRQPQGIAPTGTQNDNVANENENRQPQGIAPTKPKTVGDMVGAFQSIVTVEYIRGVKQLGWQPFNGKLWQRNYWEHIIRNEQSYQRISEYIINNPKKWDDDTLKGK